MALSIYFKLTSITEYPSDEFVWYATPSSRRKLSETVHRSMASFFYGVYIDKQFFADVGDAKKKEPENRPQKEHLRKKEEQ